MQENPLLSALTVTVPALGALHDIIYLTYSHCDVISLWHFPICLVTVHEPKISDSLLSH